MSHLRTKCPVGISSSIACTCCLHSEYPSAVTHGDVATVTRVQNENENSGKRGLASMICKTWKLTVLNSIAGAPSPATRATRQLFHTASERLSCAVSQVEFIIELGIMSGFRCPRCFSSIFTVCSSPTTLHYHSVSG